MISSNPSSRVRFGKLGRFALDFVTLGFTTSSSFHSLRDGKLCSFLCIPLVVIIGEHLSFIHVTL